MWVAILALQTLFQSHKQVLHRRRREAFVQSTSPLRVDYSTSPIYWAIAYPANCPIIRVDIVLSLP